MGLFDKKYCDICGEKIGLLGNKKLSDGNLCKSCASKLSPFFTDRKHSTLEEIKEQLNYREENKKAVAEFNPTKILGKINYVFIDSDKANFMVSDHKNYEEYNPDVIPISDILGLDTDVCTYSHEETFTNKEGKTESYRPPRYTHTYDIYLKISVKHPYFDTIKLKMNYTIEITAPGRNAPDPSMNLEYRDAVQLIDEIKAAFDEVNKTIEKKNEKKVSVKCPYCGAVTLPDKDGKCEYCGSVIDK